jgi:7-cyano-7-deazaguanine synthase
MPKAVVLLSGGLDSSVVLAMVLKSGYEVVALTFDYGQRHSRELESARSVASHYGIKAHIVMGLDLGSYGKSSLTDKSAEVPQDRTKSEIGSGIPSTYVPGRNLVFLSVASSLAESIGAEAVFIAVNSVDFSGYPDCTPEFVEAFQRTLEVGTKAGRSGNPVKVIAPIIRLSKAQIVSEAVRLGVPLELTWSCYRGGPKACGRCDSCILRLEGFAEAGLKDPIDYEVRE